MSFFQLEEMCWSGRGGLPRFDFDFDFDMLLCTEASALDDGTSTRARIAMGGETGTPRKQGGLRSQ